MPVRLPSAETSDLAIDYRPLASLIPYARNARTHSEAQVALIAGSIREYGLTSPILVDGENGIIAGHGRVLAARKLGLDLGAGDRAGPPQRERRSAPTSSPTTGSPSRPAGTASCWRWSSASWPSSASTSRTPRLRGGRARRAARPPRARPARGGDAGAAGGPGFPSRRPLAARTASAALRQLAPTPADVARLLGGVRPHLLVSDPPFGVSYDPSWRNRAGLSATKRTGKVLNDDRADWREAWALFPGEVDLRLAWRAARHHRRREPGGLRLRHPQPDHLVQGAAGALPRRLPLAARALLVRGAREGQGPLERRPQADDALEIPSRDQDAKTVHGTQKPVECMRRPMLNNSSPGQAVYEPFSGSGTSIIAAETCGRISLSMELDPAYVDVAVLRWQAFTGQERNPRRRRPQLRRDRRRAQPTSADASAA